MNGCHLESGQKTRSQEVHGLDYRLKIVCHLPVASCIVAGLLQASRLAKFGGNALA